MKHFCKMVLVSTSLFFLSSCIKTYKVPKSELPQGEKQKRYDVVARDHIKTAMVFDEYQKKAHFDVLWMSDVMRKAYAELHTAHQGKNRQEYHAFLRRQLEENKHWITFYMLVEIHDSDSMMSDDESQWTTFLQTANGETIRPEKLKEVELDPVIEHFFKHRSTGHKTPYLVTFPARDIRGRYYATDAQPPTIVVSSPSQKSYVHFGEKKKKSRKLVTEKYIKTTPQKKDLDDEDYYWV